MQFSITTGSIAPGERLLPVSPMPTQLKSRMLYDWGTLSDTGPYKLSREPELAAYLLTPGFTCGYHQQALRASNATIWNYTSWARAHAECNPLVEKMIAANLASITPEDGVRMAQRRGKSHLPFWSRLAICERLQTDSVAKVAARFNCSRRTVENVRAGRCVSFHPLTGCRQPSRSQRTPPAAIHRSRR
jgi:hypothetical protein